MKKLILFISVLLTLNFNVLANDEESSDAAPKRSPACENEESRNAFFLIRDHTKEEIEQRIKETRATIDQCETNEEGKSLSEQIAQMEEKLKGASAEGSVADKKENPKDYYHGDFGEAPKKVAVDEVVAPQQPVATPTPTAEPTVAAKKEVVAKKPTPVVSAKPAGEAEPASAAATAPTPTSKPKLTVVDNGAPGRWDNEKELAKGIANRAGNVAVNVATTARDVGTALTDGDYYTAVGDRVVELKDKAVAGAKALVAPSTGPKDDRPLSTRAAETARSVGGFLSDKESWKAMANNTWNIATGVWNNSAGKVYDASKVLADGRNDTVTNLRAMNDIAAGSAATVMTGTGVVNGARSAGTKVVEYFKYPSGKVVEVTTAANGAVTERVIRGVTEKASDQALGQVNGSRMPASTGGRGP